MIAPNPLDLTSTRLVLFDDIKARLASVQQGKPVITGGTDTYVNTVRSVKDIPAAVASFDDGEMPGCALWDLGTVFTPDSSGASAAAVWRLGIILAVRDYSEADDRATRIMRLLESLFRDVSRALFATEACQAGGADVNYSLDAWLADYDDPETGIGWIEMTVTYNEVFQVQ